MKGRGMAERTQATGCGMPPKLEKGVSTGRINIVASETLIGRIDTWRANQRPIPSKSEAARLLLERMMDLIERGAEEPQARPGSVDRR
jgi:hypothetical protein